MRKLTLSTILVFALLCFGFTTVLAQQVFKTTPKSVIGYLEYVPQDYNSNTNKYPIVIFLHGIGERGANSTDPAVLATTINNVAKLGPPASVKAGYQFPFMLISPQLKNNYGTWPAWYVMEVINHVKTYLKVDERRIYLTGLSLGGGGVWMTGQDYSALFAAIAPVCGGYNTPSKACNIAGENLPVWAFHGDKDTVVPMSKTINMVNAINNCTPKPSPLAKLTIYPGIAHNAWTNAYKTDNTIHNPNVYQWMLSYTNTKNNGNNIPVANAGADVTKALASTLTLTGAGSDIDGSIVGYTWKQVSGPSVSTLTNSLSATVTLANLKAGDYIFSLQVKDNSGNTDTDYVKLTVGASATTNVLPVANAGADQTITLPANSVTMTGSGTDSDGTISSYAWTKVSGSTATLSGATTNKLTASSLVSGSYVFRLTVTDNKGGKKSDDVTVTVKTATTTTTNAAPVANAGPNKIVYSPATSVTLSGSATDSDGSIVSYKWTQYQGAACTFTGATTPTLSVTGLKPGDYYFRLTVTDDKGATDYDNMLVSVKSTTASFTPTSEEMISIENPELKSMIVINDLVNSSEDNAALERIDVVE
jgi:predicted esterase